MDPTAFPPQPPHQPSPHPVAGGLPTTFSAAPLADPDVIKQVRYSTGAMIAYIAASFCSVGLVPLARYGLRKLAGRIILPSTCFTKLGRQRREALFNHWFHHIVSGSGGRAIERVERLKLTTPDGVTLDACAITSASQEGSLPAEQRWIVYFTGNVEQWEDNLDIAHGYLEKTGANILLFNYRGVGLSEGVRDSPEKLILDGETMMQYLIDAVGVKSEHIVVHGRSIGGGVGSQARKLHPEGGIVCDRSFASMAIEATALFGWGMAKLLRGLGWELDTVAAWEKIKGRKVIVYHHKDGIIPYQASLYKVLKEQWKRDNPEAVVISETGTGKVPAGHKTLHVRLRDEFQDDDGQVVEAHNVPLQYHPEEWDAVCVEVRQTLYERPHINP